MGARRRAATAEVQRQSLPTGRVIVTCPTRVGVGGLGRHLEEILDALERRGEPSTHIDEAPSPSESGGARMQDHGLAALARLSPAWRMWAASVSFDRYAARRLEPADELIAFNGTALAQFAAAPGAGCESVALVAANSHFRNVVRRHSQAHRDHPGIERPWVTHLLKRNLAEYERAQRIYVSSSYIWESFAEEGFADSSLALFPLLPHPRYTPAPTPTQTSTFDVVYIGSLMVHKGVPLLLDAIRRLTYPDLRLRLLGGWSTRGMRRLIERACAEDPRISVGPGDPLEVLRSSSLCVHPAYEDGFAYAPAEALACGVPVLVSEDTGMKDLIEPGVNGFVLPTGALEPLIEAIDSAYRGDTLGG